MQKRRSRLIPIAREFANFVEGASKQRYKAILEEMDASFGFLV
jgi:hypothetical protein